MDSWKEIASYLGRDVSTAQRWAQNQGLPVHHIHGARRGAVYALKSELDLWRFQSSSGTAKDEGLWSRRWRVVAFGIVLLAGVALLIGYSLSRTPRAAGMRFAPLASLTGEEVDPAFSPDGSFVAFSYRPEGQSNFQLQVKAVGSGEALRLTNSNQSERYPHWSPDGSRIAFLRRSPSGIEVRVVAALGGSERKVTTLDLPTDVGEPNLAWWGGSLILAESEGRRTPVFLSGFDLSTGVRRRLTYPPADTLGDANPVLSPDGKFLAFTRAGPSRVKDVYLLSVTGGETRRLTHDRRDIAGLAWADDGDHLVVLSDRGGPDPALWRLSVKGGEPQLIAVLPARSRMLAVARRSGRIAYTRFVVRSTIWRYAVGAAGGGPPRRERLITSSGIQAHPQYSPDGNAIAFMSDRSGFTEIWVARGDGGSPRQITWLQGEGGAPRWSPDGKRIAFDMRVEGKHGIFIVGIDGGPVASLVHDSFDNGAPSWSRDGQWVYFLSNRTGRTQVWKIPPGGGSASQVTHDGGAIAFESPAGDKLYYSKGLEEPGLYSKDLRGGAETPLIPGLRWAPYGYWQVTTGGLYYIDGGNPSEARLPVLKNLPRPGDPPGTIAFLDGEVHPPTYPGGVAAWHPLSISPDGKYLLITKLDQKQSNIMVADGGQ